MAQFTETFTSWPRGVVSAGRPDRVHHEAASGGTNAALVNITGNPVTAVPQKRLGCSVQTATGVTGNPQINGLSWFRHRTSGATYVDYSFVISASTGAVGRLDKLASGTLSAADAGTAAPFTAGVEKLPSTETMNNLWFVVNGTDQKKVWIDTDPSPDEPKVQKFGIAAPVAPTEAVLGDAGDPNGVFEFKTTYYNSNTGHESSASPVSDTCTASSKKLTVSWAASSDAQVTHVRVYARETSTQSTWFRLTEAEAVLSGGAYESAHGGWVDNGSSGSIRLNFENADLNNLIIKVPSESENNPPATGASAIAKYASRMFYTDGVDIFYSKIGFPEAFDPNDYERVNKEDGQNIIGLLAVTEGMLFIFKERSLYSLRGTDPNSWEIRLVSEAIGLSGVRAVTALDGVVYWWSQFGPYRWESGSGVQPIGFPDVADEIAADKLAAGQSSNHITDKDVERQRIFFAYTETGQTRNTKLLVYNHRLQVWEGTWDPMDIGALGNLPDSTGAPYLHIGNYKGRVFRVWDGASDGARTGYTVNGTVTSAGSTTLTDSAASFDTANDGLDELVVLAVNPNGTTQRRIITSSTGTVLTVSPAWSVVPTTDYTYVIAAPDFSWTLAHSDSVQSRGALGYNYISLPFRRKRYKQVLISALSSTGSADIDIDVHLNASITKSLTIQVPASEVSGAIFGTAKFDESVFGEAGVAISKKRIGRAARAIGFTIRNREPNTHILLIALSYMGTLVSEKS